MDKTDIIIIGAGVVGLAIARHFAQAGRDVLVLEAASAIGTGTSSRNSEVIHAGIYYPQNSLMARLCVQGRHALYAFCESHHVPHQRCGKLIVATNAEEDSKLESIRQRAAFNGVDDLHYLPAPEARALEPDLHCTGALMSPSTGILDSHAYMQALRGDAEDHGAAFAFHAPFLRASVIGGGFRVDVGGDAPLSLRCTTLINAAGLEAPIAAAAIEGMPPALIPKRYFARGNYFSLAMRAPFRRLIYPVPVSGGLGVHLTLDMGGQAKFGPDVEWIEAIDYSVDPARAEKFYPAIRKYWPGLPDGALQPAYAGVRPKIVPPDIAAQDFVIQGPATHGLPGLVHLFGIESPGLTASLALADEVAASLI